MSQWLRLLLAEILSFGCSAAIGNLNASYDKECGHGWLIPQIPTGMPNECKCDESKGFKKAGFTDFGDFMAGRCTQFMCSRSDTGDVCQDFLPSDAHASCDVEGWNCKCNWRYATGLLNGFENDRAKCMGMLYLFSDWIVTFTIDVAERVWWWFACLAFLSLGLGERRIRCECRYWSSFRVAHGVYRALFGAQNEFCDGECMRRQRFEWKKEWRHEFAWSIYFIDLGIWFYSFLLAVLITGAMLGTIIAIVFIIAVIVVLIFACLASMVDGGGGGGCGGGQGCDSGSCNCHGECCNCAGTDLSSVGSPADSFLLFGPQPTGDCECRCCEGGICSCFPRFWLCRPLAWVIVRFPKMPGNLWGGGLGWCLQTHQFARRPYSSQHHPAVNFAIDLLSLRVAGDNLHRDRGWRERVHEFIFSQDGLATNVPAQQTMSNTRPHLQRTESLQPLLRSNSRPEYFGVDIRNKNDPFDREIDHCQASTFNDYLSGTCWVCMSNEAPTWDKWVVCGHVFCTKCSEAMLRRTMPCPLCRKTSVQVVRAPKVVVG
eukprot:TRINITY_DN19181_c0_g1_i2.p1 TRINITY_DN19181_c0_g1~~TRINITY_DN19181_c0_g1_i2.p1  ORF type:complete len:544 (-),score=28.44 TRINITY_DN19181_c0_g1_i2:180-1811(-)